MKKCTRCDNKKKNSEFQKRAASKDGLTASCKECLKKYDNKRANLPHRIKARNAYSKTENYKESHNKVAKKYKENNPNKYKAHIIVNNAIRDKKLFKELCELCGNGKRVEAHHDDYLKPLNVRWLCSCCHKLWHRDHGEAKNP